MPTHPGTNPYGRLFAMTVLHLIAMYALMYSMVNTRANVYYNLNQPALFMADA